MHVLRAPCNTWIFVSHLLRCTGLANRATALKRDFGLAILELVPGFQCPSTEHHASSSPHPLILDQSTSQETQMAINTHLSNAAQAHKFNHTSFR